MRYIKVRKISRIHFHLYLLILKVVYCDIKCFTAQAVSDIRTNASELRQQRIEEAQEEKEESTNNVLKSFFCINPSLRPCGTTDAVVYVKRPGCVFFYKLVRIMKRIFVLSLPIIASSQEEPVHCKQACRINTF